MGDPYLNDGAAESREHAAASLLRHSRRGRMVLLGRVGGGGLLLLGARGRGGG